MSTSTPNSADRLGILVGYDGSESSDCALEWAVDEAKRSGRPLSIVTAYSIPTYSTVGMEAAVMVPEDESIKAGAEAVAGQGRERAEAAGVAATALTAFGDATGVMRDLSERADLVVLGARGRGGFIGLLVGSTAASVPGHSHCPTVVVPKCVAHEDERGVARENTVVVGLDGSERGRLAALVAAERAQLTGAALKLVCALPPFNGTVAWIPPSDAMETVREDVQTQLAAAREWILSHFPDLEVQTGLVDGAPARVLTSESEKAALTVVGARGGGGFVGMLLGSTSQAVLSQGRGPIMVVPERDDDPRLASRADFGPKHIPTF
ncbi:universal stress protein [Arthrobacter sp. UM1]|uniref:universal stress protein n=1 Tax=Arthrobacter sp. UM1 TaxID=2766776 RepID=UPI001CF6F4E0|nr:universal stress protein [Arthrobacter sp. UM1]MCB4208773.1 universal stress protein [Arthrobacter sp. UM1]